MRRKIILDCDPGVDDAYAIMYALIHEKINLLGITTVSGNVHIDKTTENAQKLVSFSGQSVPIAKGAQEPMLRTPYYADYIHGENGLGNYQLNAKKHPLVKEHAVEWMRKTLEREKKVSLVAVGPLSNLAYFLKLYPEHHQYIDEIIVMGGGFERGNTTAAAEFNFYVDPEAAKIVFESGVPLTMVGLDLTERCVFFQEQREALRETSFVGEMLADVSEKASELRQQKRPFTTLHDLVALMYVTRPEIFTVKDYAVSIALGDEMTRGMSIADKRNKSSQSNTRVLCDIDYEAFVEETLETFRKYGKGGF